MGIRAGDHFHFLQDTASVTRNKKKDLAILYRYWLICQPVIIRQPVINYNESEDANVIICETTEIVAEARFESVLSTINLK